MTQPQAGSADRQIEERALEETVRILLPMVTEGLNAVQRLLQVYKDNKEFEKGGRLAEQVPFFGKIAVELYEKGQHYDLAAEACLRRDDSPRALENFKKSIDRLDGHRKLYALRKLIDLLEETGKKADAKLAEKYRETAAKTEAMLATYRGPAYTDA